MTTSNFSSPSEVRGADVDGSVPAGAGARHGHHALADSKAGDAVAERAHRARDLETRDERRLGQSWPVLVQPLAQEDVDEPDRRMRDVDGDLAWSGNRIGQVNDLEHSRVAEPGGLNSLHEVLSSVHLTHLMMR
jgi:hypothetical protein